MQNAYFGDVGDFGKYGLLRVLCGMVGDDRSPALKLGVVWYLTSFANGKDGKFISYLDPLAQRNNEYRVCDSPLYDGLQDLVWKKKERKVALANSPDILGQNTCYFADELNANTRSGWVKVAVEKMRDRDMVFLDPDNGLEVGSVSKSNSSAPRYVFVDELEQFWKLGSSVVLYQHADRTEGTFNDKLRRLRDRIQAHTSKDVAILRYYRGPARAYLVCCQLRHKEVLRRRIENMLKHDWRRHFREVEVSFGATA